MAPHFQISRKNLDKLVPATIGVVGDLGVNLKELMKRDLKHQPRTEWFDSIKTWKERYPFTYGASGDAPDGLLKPQVRQADAAALGGGGLLVALSVLAFNLLSSPFYAHRPCGFSTLSRRSTTRSRSATRMSSSPPA